MSGKACSRLVDQSCLLQTCVPLAFQSCAFKFTPGAASKYLPVHAVKSYDRGRMQR